MDSEADEGSIIDAELVDELEDFPDPFPSLMAFGVGDAAGDTDQVPESDMSSGDDITVPGGNEGNDRPEDSVSSRAASGRKRVTRGRTAKPKDDEEPEKGREPKTGPPSLDEWQKFFGRIVLKTACNFYIDYAFRGIDEDSLSDREIARLAMTDDERKLVSTPLAELSNKSKFMRKHGRTIVASGDAFQAFVILGAWMSRVNRIASKHRPVVRKENANGSSRQSAQAPNGAAYTEGTTGGSVPSGYPVYRGSSG